MTRRALTLALVVTVTATLAACGHEQTGTLRVENPGRCTPVDIAAAPETAPLLIHAAAQFNESPAAHAGTPSCSFARVLPVDSAVAANEMARGWPDTETVGPAPALWVPASSAWTAPTGASFARSRLVIAFPVPLARALGYPRHPIGWADLARVASARKGWAAFGRPEWGTLRLGIANPRVAPAARNAALARAAIPRPVNTTLDRAVVYYADSTTAYFDAWSRLSRPQARAYLSAVVTDEHTLATFNASGPAASRLQLVGVAPAGDQYALDNPLVRVRRPWVTAAAAAAARAFAAFARTPAVQAAVVAAGYRSGTSQRVAPGIAPAVVAGALAARAGYRKRSRVLIVFDTSDSMGDPADPDQPQGPTKIDLARRAALRAITRFGPDDEVGLRTLRGDVVPIGKFATRRAALLRAIATLRPQGGSPLFAATRSAYDAVARKHDPARINAVIVLSDGYNEDDHDNNRNALLAHLASSPDVRVFTISYSNDADAATLQKIALATNAHAYDAGDTAVIGAVFAAALANVS